MRVTPTDPVDLSGDPVPLLVAGESVYDGVPRAARAAGCERVIGQTFEAVAEQLETATVGAVQAFAKTRRLPSYERGALLRRIAELVRAETEPLATTLAAEIGKPIADARDRKSVV